MYIFFCSRDKIRARVSSGSFLSLPGTTCSTSLCRASADTLLISVWTRLKRKVTEDPRLLQSRLRREEYAGRVHASGLGWRLRKREGERGGGVRKGRHGYRFPRSVRERNVGGASYLGRALLRGLHWAPAEIRDSNEAPRRPASPAMLTFFSRQRDETRRPAILPHDGRRHTRLCTPVRARNTFRIPRSPGRSRHAD